MIEIEKKFSLDEAQKKRLLHGADSLKKKTFTDVYFDTKEYSLILKDFWLRQRDDTFELKTPHHKDKEHFIYQYDEIVDEEEIRKRLSLPVKGDMKSDLQQAGFIPFCTCTTERESYQVGQFTIDLDHVTYKDDDITYDLAEIELMTSESEAEQATGKIIEFAKQKGLRMGDVTGKIVYYLKKQKPDVYRALCKAQGVEVL